MKGVLVRRRIFQYSISLLLMFLALFPMLWMLSTSFKNEKDAYAYPPRVFTLPTLQNYIEAFEESGFSRFYLNSVVVVVLSVTIAMAVGVPAAYAFTRYDFKGKKGLSLWILSVRIAPPIAFLIPFFVMYRKLKLIDTIMGLVIVYVAINITLVIWLMKGFFEDVPRDTEQSALVEGCTPFQVFTKVSLPICRTGIAATAVLVFIFSWNELMFAIVLTNNLAKTAPAGIYNFIGYNEVRWGALSAASNLVVLPVLIFLLLTKRHLVRGLSFGAVK